MLLYIKNKPFWANNSVHLSKSKTHGRAKTGNETSARREIWDLRQFWGARA